jgi:hypothetical protein
LEKPKKPDSTSKNTAKAKKSDIVVAQKIAPTKKYQYSQEKIKVDERAKQHAAVRSMILDHIRHSIVAPFRSGRFHF